MSFVWVHYVLTPHFLAFRKMELLKNNFFSLVTVNALHFTIIRNSELFVLPQFGLILHGLKGM